MEIGDRKLKIEVLSLGLTVTPEFASRQLGATVICILFCTTKFRERCLVVLRCDIFGH